ncbi:MAG: TlyA family rRNA (cytidine-2'-O)-methyltransferase [Desulfobacter postgatei]|uniref:TlyA family rRNA (Cytidine-2'-O)-methyltransferase n=1 Tax=Desulfobacter postgatei TaxID=2293 RepID=A0A2G6MT65_9BACT|nr:MAG: TlyA family rRNA (cytidine-2'-O)-methyltransferase [Desulfobacter postgatei]
MKNKILRKRLDQKLVDQGLVRSRQRAKAMIMAGKVLVNGIKVDKPGTQVNLDAPVAVKAPDHPYVSRGGLKLEKALQHFPVSVQDAVCLDIGASTGGFTDCLLKFGAKKVYAVDVGYGQLDWALRQDDRVVVLERTNIRHLPYDAIGHPMDAVVADTSFISLKTVIPAAEKFMRPGTNILALIKPQFEAGKEHVGKGGIVRVSQVRDQVKQDIRRFFQNRGYTVNGTVTSPVLGAKGNEEYIISLVHQKKIK